MPAGYARPLAASVAAVQAELKPLRSIEQAGHQQMGQSLLPGVLAVAVPVAAAAAAKPAADCLATDCLLGFPCQPAVWGPAGGRHGTLAIVVDLQLVLVSRW